MGTHVEYDKCRKCGGDATVVISTKAERYKLVCEDENCCFMTITTPISTTRLPKEDWKDFAEEFFIDDEELA